MIDVRRLSKAFGAFVAVDDLSFHVPKGQILGFLGPNGAGKSTTMKMLTGFLEPSGGTAVIGGADVTQDSLTVRRQLGYLAESAPSYGEMTVLEFLTFITDVRGLRGTAAAAARDRVRGLCHLEDVWQQPIETLSKGYRQRVGFAQALIHDPAVLILDEPTDGLDPNQKHEVRQLIRRMGQEDKTIILSTHILEEVEAVCARAVIIARGKLLADATPEELRARSPRHKAVIARGAPGELARLKSLAGGLAGVKAVEDGEDGGSVRFYPRPQAELGRAVADVARSHGIALAECREEQGRLDEVFRHITLGGTGKEASA